MGTRKIVEIGDEKLRKHCKPVTKFDLRLKVLLKDMAETMYQNDGAGLAAPQVGILKRACVVDVGDHLYELVNPEIITREGDQEGPEGCLSIPGRVGVVKRPMHVTVRAQTVKGDPVEVTAEGFLARAFCHEIDHLDGVLYVDIMERELDRDDEQGEMENEEKVSFGAAQPSGQKAYDDGEERL